ncbi:MAG: hypothetical protein ACKOYM_03750 [Actinomycetes bacterium]
MLLAEVEAFYSRPIAPTRRLALGATELPCDPAPGYGGLLLGAVVAQFARHLDPDDHGEIEALIAQLERRSQVPQPRLRHRLQDDTVGLIRCVHRLHAVGEELAVELDEGHGSPTQHVLCAVYAAATLPLEHRPTVMAALRRAMGWRGGTGPSLFAYLSGSGSASVTAVGDPVAWAISVLALEPAPRPSRREVQRAFRDQLRDAHPDHGAADDGAAQRIAELSEARRILLGR